MKLIIIIIFCILWEGMVCFYGFYGLYSVDSDACVFKYIMELDSFTLTDELNCYFEDLRQVSGEQDSFTLTDVLNCYFEDLRQVSGEQDSFTLTDELNCYFEDLRQVSGEQEPSVNNVSLICYVVLLYYIFFK